MGKGAYVVKCYLKTRSVKTSASVTKLLSQYLTKGHELFDQMAIKQISSIPLRSYMPLAIDNIPPKF